MAMPDVQFAPVDARAVETSIITGFEAAARLAGQTDFTLYNGDPRRLFLQAVALMIVQQNNLIDITGKGNLLRYAGNATIEDLGWLYGPRADRLQPSNAVTTVEFTISAERNTVTTIPAGTRVVTGDLTFATMTNLNVMERELTGTVMAMCDAAGPQANGMVPGQVFQIMDPVPFVESAVNLTTSAGGADLEDLEAYRERVRNTPESFSTAGPDGAYWFWAKTANAGIIDVDVWMPDLDYRVFGRLLGEILGYNGYGGGFYGHGEYGGYAFEMDGETAAYWYTRFMDLCRETGTGPGNVNVVPLMQGGDIPTEDILDAVYDICNDRIRRPLTDFLHVLKPVVIEYDLRMTYWIDANRAVDAVVIQNAVNRAVDDYVQWQCGELGRAIIPDALIRRVMEAGARRTEVVSPTYKPLKLGEVARLVHMEVKYGGLERRIERAV